MIEIDITDDQRRRANELYEFNVLNGSVTRGEGNEVGALGEIIVLDKTNFDRPSFVGDIITYTSTIKALGRSSIQIRVKVKRESMEGEVEEICSSNMTFVTMKDGKPFPHNLTWDKLTN